MDAGLLLGDAFRATSRRRGHLIGNLSSTSPVGKHAHAAALDEGLTAQRDRFGDIRPISSPQAFIRPVERKIEWGLRSRTETRTSGTSLV